MEKVLNGLTLSGGEGGEVKNYDTLEGDVWTPKSTPRKN